ncbi:MAG TPA: type II toxin-antitoxin system VapC family toxin [Longimicrobium sp.]|jgi:predicted nucleic acid-binding protein
MVYFLDTSATVRLYVVEAGWLGVRAMLRSAVADPAGTVVCLCDLVLPGTVSAFRQIAYGGEAARRGFSPAAHRRVLPQVRADLTATKHIPQVPASGCTALATTVVERQQLRGADAVHVAAALTARDAVAAERFVFVSHDQQQCRAAEREGLQVLTLA